MGKSDKKVKSEKLNFLRKQYEAFLEEDKKRKERNEYILGRLDEMRSCTALVTSNKLPPRILKAYQPGPLISTRRSDSSVIPLYQSKHTHSQSTSTTPFPVDIPTKSSQEALFLQEIVKKYILIPKSEYYSDPSTEENADWKSKYEILNHLNDIDIEKDNVPTREDREFMKTDTSQDIAADDLNDPLKQLLNKLPVKDDFKLKSRQSSIEIKAQTDLKSDYNYNSTSLQAAPNKHDEIPSKYTNYDKLESDISEVPRKVEHQSYEYNRDTLNVTSNVQKHQLVSKYESSDMIVRQDKPQEDLVALKKDNKVDNEKIANPGQHDYDYIQTQTVNHRELTNANQSSKAEEGTTLDENEYPIEMINVSDFTPNDGVKLQDGVNINPEGYHIAASMYNEPTVNYENNVDYGEPGPIVYDNGSEFSTNCNYEYNAPQTENYENSVEYNEPTVTNPSNVDYVEYNEPRTTVHEKNYVEQVANLAPITQTETQENTENQNPVQNEISNLGQDQDQEYNPTEPVAVENTVDESAIEEFEAEQRDMFYQPQDETIHSQEDYVENYQENQYQYYEGTQEVPVEINEHEEATLPYDQTYEAQYGAYQQPGFEQQEPGYEQQQQQPVYEQQQKPVYEQQQKPVYEQQQQPVYEQQQPGYEQQHFNQQAVYDQQSYDQQQVYDQQSQPEQQGYYEQQQYNQSHQNYDQQAYDKLQYEQQTYENPQGIEQQLDNEQGYIGPNPVISDQDIEKEIINDAEKVHEQVNPNIKEEVPEVKEQKEAMQNPS